MFSLPCEDRFEIFQGDGYKITTVSMFPDQTKDKYWVSI